MTFRKTVPKSPKKTLVELLSTKEVIMGKDVIHELKEQEKRQKEFEESVEDELRNRRGT
jgi:hypothetical protein